MSAVVSLAPFANALWPRTECCTLHLFTTVLDLLCSATWHGCFTGEFTQLFSLILSYLILHLHLNTGCNDVIMSHVVFSNVHLFAAVFLLTSVLPTSIIAYKECPVIQNGMHPSRRLAGDSLLCPLFLYLVLFEMHCHILSLAKDRMWHCPLFVYVSTCSALQPGMATSQCSC